MSEKNSICIIAQGGWGAAIAKLVGTNCIDSPEFENEVMMYVKEEIIDEQNLTDIINTTHENVKDLPGYKLPENIIAMSDVVECAKNADVLIFAVTHRSIYGFCKPMIGKIKPSAIAISLVKGFVMAETGGLELISNFIAKMLKVPCSVVMGASLVNEVAEGTFCETTIGCRDVKYAKLLRDLFQAKPFRVVIVDDADAVEICGALRNIIAVGAGIIDGMDLNDNSKSAMIRMSLMEMIQFVDIFYPGSKLSTFFESCGLSDLVTGCFKSRNRLIGEGLVRTGKTINELETLMMNGQMVQGPLTAAQVNHLLRNKNMEDKFPIFTAIHKICTYQALPNLLMQHVCVARDHVYHPTNLFPL